MNKLYSSTVLLLGILLLGASPALAQGDTLVVSSAQTIKTLDPQNTTAGVMYGITCNIYETLITQKDGKLVPLLAESWKLLDDKVTYVFTLKQGVKFHNGDPMTADDVVYTFQRALSPAAAATKGQSMYLAEAGKIDEKTVYLKAVAPMGYAFMANLTHQWAGIYNKKYTEAMGLDYGQNPMGTGKFKFKRAIPGDRVELERFEDYHGQKAKVKNLIFRTIVEVSSRTMELESGAIDVAVEISPIDVKRIKNNPKLEVVEVPSYRILQIGFETTLPPYDNPKVREAIHLAINREGISKAVFRGFSAPAKGPVPNAINYIPKDATPPPYDPARAKQLLAEAGFPNGFKGSLITSERYELQNTATVVQNNLREIGIDMKIRIVETGALNDVITMAKHDPFVYVWGGNVPLNDPFFYMNPLYHSKQIGSTNRYYYNSPELDKQLDLAVQAQEGDERAGYYAEAWNILNKDVPASNLISLVNLYGKTKNLKGVTLSPSLMTNFGEAYFE